MLGPAPSLAVVSTYLERGYQSFVSSAPSDDLKADVLRATDIVDLISSHVPLKRSGKRFTALCPFHKEKTPSFSVSPELQIFKCFGCGVGGDVFSFVMKRESVDFPDALRMLADRAGLDTTGRVRGGGGDQEKRALLYRVNDWADRVFRDQLASSDAAQACRDYIAGRGISEPMHESFGLGYAMPHWDVLLRRAGRRSIPEEALLTAGLIRQRDSGQGAYDYFRNRLMFPIAGTDGKVVGFGGRALDDNPAKYLNSPDTPVFSKGRILYGIFQARDAILEKRRAVVVEGYTDVIMAHQQGVQNVVAVLGTALTADHIHLLRRFADEVVLVFDGDAAGQRSADRSLDIFVEEDMPVRLATLPDGLDPFDMLVQRGREAFESMIDGAGDLFDFKLSFLRTQHDVTSLNGRTAAAQELVAVAVRSPDPVREELLMKRVADELGLSISVVMAEAARVRPSPRRRGDAQVPGPSAASGNQTMDASLRAQRVLIGAMVNDSGIVPEVEGAVGEAGFFDGRLRLIARQIFSLSREDAVVDSRRIIETISDPEVTEAFADICAQEGSRPQSPEEIAGTIDYLVNNALVRNDLTVTREKTLQANREGNEDAEREFLARYQERARMAKTPRIDTKTAFDET